jgi:hypothetical protein
MIALDCERLAQLSVHALPHFLRCGRREQMLQLHSMRSACVLQWCAMHARVVTDSGRSVTTAQLMCYIVGVESASTERCRLLV